MEGIYGRKNELERMDAYYHSGRAEFVALYGRRRVGKTFLVDEFFNHQYSFTATGVIDGKRSEQMAAFMHGLRDIGYTGTTPKSWMDAFYELSVLLEKNMKQGERCVLFIDELPCFDTPKAGFVRAFGHFWNSWGQRHKEVMLVVCGSATTWMIENLIDNHGGLHDRITREIHLRPFNLCETEQMLRAMDIVWDRLAIMQYYMVVGGVPYYLSLVEQGESVNQAIDRLFFADNAPLKREYERLFASLFRKPDPYLEILRVLSQQRMGVTREEIAKAVGLPENGHLTEYLKSLEKCDFVRYYFIKNKKIKKTDGLYQLTDLFVIFYNTYMTKPITDAHYWSVHNHTPLLNNWYGLSFERVCMAHIPQIKHALGIDRIGVEYYSWRSKESAEGAQVDLLLERADRIINLCEMKYSKGLYTLDKDEDLNMRTRMEDFTRETDTKYGVMPILVSTYGLKRNMYSGGIQQQVTMEDLFKEGE